MEESNKFAILFKRYRLLSQFSKIPELVDAFEEKGFHLEISTYYHWQRGKRIPTRRGLLISLIILFIEHNGITLLKQANELLDSAGHGYLTKREIESNALITYLK